MDALRTRQIRSQTDLMGHWRKIQKDVFPTCSLAYTRLAIQNSFFKIILEWYCNYTIKVTRSIRTKKKGKSIFHCSKTVAKVRF